MFVSWCSVCGTTGDSRIGPTKKSAVTLSPLGECLITWCSVAENEEPINDDSASTEAKFFRVHTSVVFQLGESLISDVVQAIVELVKNSYDADATFARVLVDTKEPPPLESHYPKATGYILIEDDGSGMSHQTIEEGWLTISDSKKRRFKKEQKLTVLGRTPLGDKGLGRLGTQRLGQNLEIFTRPETSDVEYHVAFSWRDFQTATEFSEVPIFVKTSPAKRKYGTTLLISDLKDKNYWSNDAADKLQEDLSKMISPYREVRNFHVAATVNGARLDLAEFTEKVRETAQLRYRVDFDGKEFSINGRARLNFFRPEKEEDRVQFKYLVEADDGQAFYDFLSKKKAAAVFNLNSAQRLGWFVTYDKSIQFADMDKLEVVEDEVTHQPRKANPGPFHAEIDSFDLGADIVEQNVFDRVSEYKKYIKKLSGIRVYRDGFGIRVDPDWLGLGKQQTSGRSFYGLRPQNTLGYVALTAQHNSGLEEKTDREGFKVTPYYNNFNELMRLFVDFASRAQTFIRREFNEFKKANREKAARITEGEQSKDISVRVIESLSKAASHKEHLVALKEDLDNTAEDTRQALKEVNRTLLGQDLAYRHQVRASEQALNGLVKAKKEIEKVEQYLNEVIDSKLAVGVLNTRFESLQEEVEEFVETSSLGLTAEALSHEIHQIAEQLAHRTRQISDYFQSAEVRDAKLVTYIEYVNSSVNALRKQIAHLSPSLKYVREKRETILVTDFFKETVEYYRERLIKENIEVEVKIINGKNFNLFMNKGKLVQVIDNLFLNSEYWIREDIRLKRIASGTISVEISKPFVRISDNGPGIDPSVESRLFDPFVTTKGRGKGRGLGLFIVNQFLDSEGGSISLLPKRNPRGRLYVFELDFTGVPNGSK